jgi:hypothetical protein
MTKAERRRVAAELRTDAEWLDNDNPTSPWLRWVINDFGVFIPDEHGVLHLLFVAAAIEAGDW